MKLYVKINSFVFLSFQPKKIVLQKCIFYPFVFQMVCWRIIIDNYVKEKQSIWPIIFLCLPLPFSSSLFWCYILKAFSYSSQESESFVIVGMFSPFSQFFYKLTSAFKSNAYTVCHFYKLTSAFKSVLWNKWTFFKFISGPQSSQINGLICGPKLFFFEFFLKNVKLEKFLFYFLV